MRSSWITAAVLVLCLVFAWALPAVAQEGPTVTITSPADGEMVSGSTVPVTWEASGVNMVAPAEAKSKEEGHFHAFLDTPVTPAGEVIPKSDKVKHVTGYETTFENVAPGEHTVSVVLGYSDHTPWQPPVVDEVTFTVSGAGQVAPATGRGPGGHGVLLFVAMVGMVVIGAGVALRAWGRRKI